MNVVIMPVKPGQAIGVQECEDPCVAYSNNPIWELFEFPVQKRWEIQLEVEPMPANTATAAHFKRGRWHFQSIQQEEHGMHELTFSGDPRERDVRREVPLPISTGITVGMQHAFRAHAYREVQPNRHPFPAEGIGVGAQPHSAAVVVLQQAFRDR